MNSPSAGIPFEYRQPFWGELDRTLRNCFRGAATLGVIVLVAVFVVPKPAVEDLQLDEVPERFARLIVEQPEPPAPVVQPDEKVAVMDAPKVEEPAKVDLPEPPARTERRTRKRTTPRPVDPEAGARGREVATAQVTANLEEVQGSLDKALENLSATLPAATEGSSSEGTKRKRPRRVRGGKDRSELGAVAGVQTTGSGDVGGTALSSNGISIAAIDDLGGDGVGDGDGIGTVGGGGIGGNGEFRSNASLLAVVRRYAAGIQFCYDNQLKKQPGLQGKLVVALTVLADGTVSEAVIVQDKLGSGAVSDCVLAQINAWKFPPIEQGTVRFKTPFVFTPPQ